MQEDTESHRAATVAPAHALLDLVDAGGRQRDTAAQLSALCRHAHGCLRASGQEAEAGALLPARSTGAPAAGYEGESARLLQLFELERDEGPAREVIAGRRVLTDVALDRDEVPWPGFARRARELGVLRLTALPLNITDELRGALVVYSTRPVPLESRELVLLGALADATGLGLSHVHKCDALDQEAGQLRHALTSRVPIEQAKGALSERLGCTPDEAFTLLWSYARAHRRKLHEVSREVVEGTLREPPFTAPQVRR